MRRKLTKAPSQKEKRNATRDAGKPRSTEVDRISLASPSPIQRPFEKSQRAAKNPEMINAASHVGIKELFEKGKFCMLPLFIILAMTPSIKRAITA